jgi:multidrug efflux pump subunit AcrB
VSNFLSGSLSGLQVSTYREGNELVEILLRGPKTSACVWTCSAVLAVPTPNGSVPLSQIANIEYAFEDGIIWHRNRLPTVTVRADIRDGITPPTVVATDTAHAGRNPQPNCRRATCCRPAARSRIRPVARTRSRPACRCSCWPWPRC